MKTISISCKSCGMHGLFLYNGKPLYCPSCNKELLGANDEQVPKDAYQSGFDNKGMDIINVDNDPVEDFIQSHTPKELNDLLGKLMDIAEKDESPSDDSNTES